MAKLFKDILHESKMADIAMELEDLIASDKTIAALAKKAGSNDSVMMDFLDKFMNKFKKQMDDLKKKYKISDSDIGTFLSDLI